MPTMSRSLIKRTPIYIWMGTLRVRIGWSIKIGRWERVLLSDAATGRAIKRAKERAGHI